jgi:Raf kinase inhibitor-like YbhB/YbcL family protein
MKPVAEVAFLLVVCLGNAFAQQAKPATTGAAAPFMLSSTAFAMGAEIPQQYSCKGEDMSPPLAWSGAPASTVTFAIIMDDPDAPGGDWVHWVVWNLPKSERSLPQAVARQDHMSDGGLQGKSSFRKTGYSGPCPPRGAPHRYYFRLYALDADLNLPAGANRTQLDAAMKGHVLAETGYMGTFHK